MRVADPLHPVRRLGLSEPAGSFIHLRHKDWAIGEFYCLPIAPDFVHRATPSIEHLVVLPRLPVGIERPGEDAVVADRASVIFHNRSDVYRRRRIGELGDHCFWIRLADPIVRALVAGRAPDAADADRPLPVGSAPMHTAAHLEASAIVHALLRGDSLDPLEIDERVRFLVGVLIDAGLAARGRSAPAVGEQARSARRAAVYDARAYIADHCCDAFTLDDVADAADVSVHHLCRLFRSHTGMTMHAYRNRLRLRFADEALRQGHPDLTSLALDLGFASHSHFTDAFRREFGAPPSRIRAASKIPEVLDANPRHRVA